MNRPFLAVVAGPNGSGKSTLIQRLISENIDLGTYINADDIARDAGLVGDAGTREAQRRADALREDCLARRINFSFETVMSHPSKVEFMERAALAGFFVSLYFVATQQPRLNIERVRHRVKMGGHDVPHDLIVSRYHRTIALLPSAIQAADQVAVFDNSSASDPHRLILKFLKRDGTVFVDHRDAHLPPWALQALQALTARS